MRGELTADRLMEIAATNDQKTEARTYVGMDLLLKGGVQDAREHFMWVRDYGNKRFIEYTRSLWPSSAGCSGDAAAVVPHLISGKENRRSRSQRK